MATVGSLIVKIGSDLSGLEKGLSTSQQKIGEFGRSMTKLGAGLSAGVTAPILGVVAAANKAGTALNREMGNVQSLGLTQARVQELKAAVQDTAIEVGKGTTDIAAGLYQTVSAFGDSADTAKILDINAKAAAAGLASTEDAIALTSAVTKGYGDTSAEAVQQASDLAFQTVKLGQTTFPELANSIGKVVPLASSLGLAQEELFAVMATGTGVTGSASEVTTQMRGTLQALMAPTATMTDLMEEQGYATGEAMIEALGYQGTILAIVRAAEKSGTPLQKYISSIEGQTLALALSGSLTDDYTAKLEAMQQATGATDAAFAAQTEGINSSGFAAEQAAVKWEVFLQKLDEGLAPAKAAVIDALSPIADKLLELGEAFAGLDEDKQKFIVAVAGIAAALGPALIAIGAVVSAIGAIGLTATLVGLGMVVLAVLVAANWETIKTKTTEAVDAMTPYWETFLGWIDAAKTGDFGPLVQGLKDAAATLGTLGLEKLGEAKISLMEKFDTTGLAEKLKLDQYMTFDLAGWIDTELSKVQKISIGDLFTGTIQLKTGQITAAFGGQNFSFDLGAVVAKGNAAITGLASELTTAFEAEGWAGVAEVGRTKITGLATALIDGLHTLYNTVMLSLGVAGLALQMEFTAAMQTADSFVDLGAVRDWIARSKETAKEEVAKALTGDNLLTRSIAKGKSAWSSIQGNFEGFGDLGWVERFERVMSSLSTALTAYGEIKFDVVQTGVDLLVSLGTKLADLAATGVEKINADGIANIITSFVTGYSKLAQVLGNEENAAQIGTAIGNLAGTLVTKLGEVLGSEDFGAQVGEQVGKAGAALANGAFTLAESVADQLALVDWGQFAGQIKTFVNGFVSAFFTALWEGLKDRTIFGQAGKDAVGDIQQGGIADAILRDMGIGWLFGVGKLPASDVATTVPDEGVAELDRTAAQAATSLGTVPESLESAVAAQVAAANETTAVWENSPLGKNSSQWPGMDLTMQDPVDVTANVVSVAPAAEPPVVDVVAKATQVDTSAADVKIPYSPDYSAMLPLAQPGADLQSAVDTLTSWSFEWPSLPEWTWPSLPVFSWPSLPTWHWPSIPSPSWLGRLQVPRPDWLGELLSWSPTVQVKLASAPATGGVGENAMGTPFWPGGLTWVGEQGPELVNLPRGSAVYSAAESRQMTEGEAAIHIHLDGMVVNNQLDLEAMAYDLARRIDRHRRR